MREAARKRKIRKTEPRTQTSSSTLLFLRETGSVWRNIGELAALSPTCNEKKQQATSNRYVQLETEDVMQEFETARASVTSTDLSHFYHRVNVVEVHHKLVVLHVVHHL